jgi:2-hydroxychromene-2-carboxylate isomerase
VSEVAVVKAVEFFFDFSSPYSYLAAERIEDIAKAQGAGVVWRPLLLGIIFKAVKGAPLTEYGLKGPYSVRDFARSARFAGIAFKMPEPFPIATHNAARAVLAVDKAAAQRTGEFVRAVFRAYFLDNRPINEPAELAAIADALGLEGKAIAAACADDSIKEALRANCDEALRRGVFGAPFMFVGDEPFWGNDRLPQLERWLASGGF